MILDCPHCGYSGRLPDHASPATHRARCPKCRLGFHIDDPRIRALASVDSAGARTDPDDSSYELDPIVAGPDDPWEGPWSDGPDEPWDGDWSGDPGVVPPPPRAAPASRLPVVLPPVRVAHALRPATLRIRLFQAWAVAFMAAAAAIALRTAVAAWRFDDARFFSDELLRPVAAVVLLVCAAALLCLSVDVSRRLTRLSYGPPQPLAPFPPPPPRRPSDTDGDGRRDR
ncbi:hypothetical protein [Paludisphaera sp.]|uniref:hypothetical protein n=1 Tax=Paludisphaera sp. TaxID=2017432 RepID=UPI00301C3D4E